MIPLGSRLTVELVFVRKVNGQQSPFDLRTFGPEDIVVIVRRPPTGLEAEPAEMTEPPTLSVTDAINGIGTLEFPAGALDAKGRWTAVAEVDGYISKQAEWIVE